MKHKICETCGKELKHGEVFTVNGKIECEDCANSKPCSVCGKMLKPKEIHFIDKKVLCQDCHKKQIQAENEKRENNRLLTINPIYNDKVMEYLLRDAPTRKNAEKMLKNGIISAIIFALIAAFNFFLGNKLTSGFNIVAIGACVFFAGSLFSVILSRKKLPDYNAVYKKYHDSFSHPVFSSPEAVQEAIDEIRNNYVFADDEIALSSKYFVQRGCLTNVIKTDDIIGVTNIAANELTGSYIHYLVIIDRFNNKVKIRYLKNPKEKINLAMGALGKYCVNSKCVMNGWISGQIPDSVKKHVAEFKRNNKGTKAQYEIDDISYIKEIKRSKAGAWVQYDVLLAARGYGWETILDWADYVAGEDVSKISKVAVALMPGMPETDYLNEYSQSGSFSKTEQLKIEKGLFTIGGLSKELGAPLQIVWLNQTNVLRFFTTTDDETLMTRYIETMIRRTFNTPDSMKLAKPVEE